MWVEGLKRWPKGQSTCHVCVRARVQIPEPTQMPEIAVCASIITTLFIIIN